MKTMYAAGWLFLASMLSQVALAAEGQVDLQAENINLKMFLLFLVVSLIGMFILNKFAWGPILDGLDSREKNIADSLENADKIEHELATLDDTVQNRIAAADDEAKGIVAEARKGGDVAARHIEQEARDEARIVMDNAKRDIEAESAKVRASLQTEGKDIALALAGKILGENLDDEKNRALTDRIIDSL